MIIWLLILIPRLSNTDALVGGLGQIPTQAYSIWLYVMCNVQYNSQLL